MSTRGTIATVETQEVVGGIPADKHSGETFHQSLHFYQECFDESEGVCVELFQQGVFSNTEHIFALPHDKAIELFTALGKWAAAQEPKP